MADLPSKVVESFHLEDEDGLEEFRPATVIDAEIERRLRRKFDFRILPIVTLIFLFAFIDRYAR